MQRQPPTGFGRVAASASLEIAFVVGRAELLGLGVAHDHEDSGTVVHTPTLSPASLPVMPSPGREGEHVIDTTPRATGRGPLMIIGGAEEKPQADLLTEFVRGTGGPQARIAVVATASSLGPEVIEVYDAIFSKLGAAEVVSARPESRERRATPPSSTCSTT